MRPAVILTKDGGLKNVLWNLAPSIKVDVLANVLVDVAVNGNSQQIFENADMNQFSK